MRRLVRFLCDDTAATAVEYSVILSLILLVMIAAIGAVGSQTGGLWGGIVSKLRATGFLP